MDDGRSVLDPLAGVGSSFPHSYAFDPSHGYELKELLEIDAGEEPADFEAFWRKRYEETLRFDPGSRLQPTGRVINGWRIFDWFYTSTDETPIQGWAILPAHGDIRRAFIISHGYGGRSAPDLDLPLEDAALFFPCARGLGRSRHPRISANAAWHVLHDIEYRDRYVIGGCVDDIWLAVSAACMHYPQVAGHVGYLGISFGGGIGALSMPWDDRIQMGHLNVPTFGHQRLRLELASVGSAASVQQFHRRRPQIVEATLPYYDAAFAARHLHRPVHCACAPFDPAVAPAGQFAIYNALPGPKQFFLLKAGHHQYPEQAQENRRLRQEIHKFFRDL